MTATLNRARRGTSAAVRWTATGVCSLFFLVGGCGKQKPASPGASEHRAVRTNPPPVRVQLTAASERSLPRFLRVTGQLHGMQDSFVAADSAGKVVETLVERGSVVEAGGVLIKLDPRTATLSVNEAQAEVALAEANLALAKNEAERNAPLAKTKAIAEADFRKLEADVAVREANLAAAVARRELAEKALVDATIRSPFAGIVAERFVQAGEYVTPGTRVARVVETSRLRLLLNVPETAASLVRAGQEVQFTTGAFPGVMFSGTIKFLGAAVRESARDLIVEADVSNQDGRLKPGFFADARVHTTTEQVVAVPAKALHAQGNRRSVFSLEKGGLVERLVEVGEVLDEWIEIRRGLKSGDEVVLSAEGKLADGVPASVAQTSLNE